jgi:hypothetical protein
MLWTVALVCVEDCCVATKAVMNELGRLRTLEKQNTAAYGTLEGFRHTAQVSHYRMIRSMLMQA